MTATPRGNITGRDPDWGRFDGHAIVRVVGTEHRQPALFAAIHAPSQGEFRFECLATLVPEPDNAHDNRAVKVTIGEHHVGYLTRGSARRHHRKLAAMRAAGESTAYLGFVRRDEDEGPLLMSLRVPRDGKLFNPLKVTQ